MAYLEKVEVYTGSDNPQEFTIPVGDCYEVTFILDDGRKFLVSWGCDDAIHAEEVERRPLTVGDELGAAYRAAQS